MTANVKRRHGPFIRDHERSLRTQMNVRIRVMQHMHGFAGRLVVMTYILTCGWTTAAAQSHVAPPSAVVCDACHGYKGEGLPALNGPRLGGLQAWYVERQLKNFKAGIRGGDPADVNGGQMKTIAANLATDGSIREAAAFVSNLTPPTPKHSVQGSVERGKILFGTCAACHGPGGEGQESTQAPRLQGSNDWYVVRQLEAFRAGRRGSDSRDTYGQQMRAIALTLPDEQALRDVAAYIGTLE
jgi:cytochrome c oxidase subunit II